MCHHILTQGTSTQSLLRYILAVLSLCACGAAACGLAVQPASQCSAFLHVISCLFRAQVSLQWATAWPSDSRVPHKEALYESGSQAPWEEAQPHFDSDAHSVPRQQGAHLSHWKIGFQPRCAWVINVMLFVWLGDEAHFFRTSVTGSGCSTWFHNSWTVCSPYLPPATASLCCVGRWICSSWVAPLSLWKPSPQEQSWAVKQFWGRPGFCIFCVAHVTHTLPQKAFFIYTIIGKGVAVKWWLHFSNSQNNLSHSCVLEANRKSASLDVYMLN